jgi:hypothetical protein
LASTGQFSYPTNFLNRFAYSPYVGVLIQKMLFDRKYSYFDELSDIGVDVNFKSYLGKTKGALAISEFQHFFRNYMNNYEPRYLNSGEIQNVNFVHMAKDLASIEQAFNLPFITKSVMLQLNLDSLFKAIPKSIFFYTKRDPLYNMQSILIARQKYHGNKASWFSVKPKEYEMLKDMGYHYQIAGQVFFTRKSIERVLEKIPLKNKLVVSYEDFCKNTPAYYEKIIKIYSVWGYNLKKKYAGPSCFKISNRKRINTSELEKLKTAYKYFQKNQ